jgi:predicted dehydrogenase
MMRYILLSLILTAFILSPVIAQEDGEETPVLRAGMIGLTTSHVPAFQGVINNPDAEGPLTGVMVTDAVTGGAPDNASGWPRREGYTNTLRERGVVIHETMEEMLPEIDVVMVMSVDGRPHLEYAKKAIEAGKPVYLDKPMAGSLADVIEIFRLGEEHGVPVFSASSLRYSSGFQAMRNDSPVGKILGCDAYSPCSYEEHHPDLFWYGVHGVETLFTIMGAGCESVQRTVTPDADFVVGVWEDGRIGTFRGTRKGKHGYGAFVYGEQGDQMAGTYEGYAPLCVEICRFFQTGVAPVEPQETIEIFAFMEAADESKRQDGARVSLEDVIEKAKAE